MTTRTMATVTALAAVVAFAPDVAMASGHGPVFGAATPTLGRGAWSLDQAWTLRVGEKSTNEQMFKTMVTFGITEVLQVSASIPEVMSETTLNPARMMSAMSNERAFEGLIGYRFHRTPVGTGGRRESTMYLGGTIPFERTRAGAGAGGSIVVGAATGYASRAHYLWFGGNLQHYLPRSGDRLDESRTLTLVYGYRPRFLRTDSGPDLRFFVESTFEDRGDARTVFIGPTSLFVYKAMALSGGVQWPASQRQNIGAHEALRVAINFSYFWFK